jgi:chromosome segregation ATPase
LSTQGTQVVKSTLNSEQRNTKAESHMEIMQAQLEGLRSDIRTAAQGLRKAGEVSRQLLGRLDATQMELTLTEPENNRQLQQLVEQSQQALKESIEGLVLASQKINMGQHESDKLAEYMAVNQTAWSNLLNQVEQVAESASQESENALRLAKRLMDKSQQNPLTVPINANRDQAAKAPPQLLP